MAAQSIGQFLELLLAYPATLFKWFDYDLIKDLSQVW